MEGGAVEVTVEVVQRTASTVPGGGPLPQTGNELLALLGLALCLIAAGGLMLVISRHRLEATLDA